MEQNVSVQRASPALSMTVAQMMKNDAVKSRFQEVLGEKSKGFISSVISVSNSPSLKKADPQSVLSSAMIAATLDLPINPNLGYAYIIARRDGKTGQTIAQFQMGYKGFVQLAERSGKYKTINVTDIREGEIVNEDLITGEFELKKLSRSERCKAKVIGYIAYIELINGFRKSLFMTNEELQAHAKKYSQSYQSDKYGTSLWNTQFDSMAMKTVLKQLLSKYGLLSIEMQDAVRFDQSQVKMSQDLSVEDAEPIYVDNMPVIEEAVPEPADDLRAKAERIKAENEAKAKAMQQAGDLFANEAK